MKKIAFLLLLLAGLCMLQSCYYDNEEDLYGLVNCPTDPVSYQTDIVPILESNCFQCHSSALQLGGINLEGYENVLVYVNNGGLVGSVRYDPGFSPMPQSAAQLDDCTIDYLERWVADGAPNN